MNASNRSREIWKVRAVKSYPEAHDHLLIGRLIDRDDTCVTLHCRTVHFGRVANRPEDINVGSLGTRIIPWGRIEIVNVLAEGFDYQQARVQLDRTGALVLHDGQSVCPITSRRERSL